MQAIALTNEELDHVMRQARRVPRGLRDEYLQCVAAILKGRPFNQRDLWQATADAVRIVTTRHAREQVS